MAKQTAIQEIMEKIEILSRFNTAKSEHLQDISKMIGLYIEAEKEQIRDAYLAGTAQFDNAAPIVNHKTPDDYYKETYG